MLALLPMQPDLSVTRELERVMVVQEGSSGPSSWNNPLLNCSATSQVRIFSVKTTATQDHYWMLQSLDANGLEKTVGGDEFYVSFLDAAYYMNNNNNSYSDGSSNSFHHHPTAVAFVHDQGDGTYHLDFVTSPFNYDPNKALMGHGLLTVAFQYTCGIGSMMNHSKMLWKHGGTSTSTSTSSGSPTTATTLTVNATVSQAPLMRIFQKPSVALFALNNFSNVHVFGDSTMCQMVGTVWEWNGKTKTSHKDNNYTNLCMYHSDLIDNCLTTPHQCARQLAHVINPETIMEAINGIVNGTYCVKNITNNNNETLLTVLIMGVGARDLLRNPDPQSLLEGGGAAEEYTSPHLIACQMMIEKIRELYPNIMLIWRSPTAMHIHVTDVSKLSSAKQATIVMERVRYLSTSRVERLYLQQKALMEKLHVTFLDVYEATYLLADYTEISDAVHYTPEANARILSWLYPDY